MTPEELKAIENRCNKATPGPWTTERPGVCPETGFQKGITICNFGGRIGVFADPPGGSSPYNDSVFVAYARVDIPQLLEYIKKLEDQIPKWIHVIDNPPKENEEVLFGLFDPITQVFQGYMREGYIFSDSHDERFLPFRGMYWQVLPGLPKNIYKDLEKGE